MSREALVRRALELFDGALDLPESEWGAFLDRACEGQPDLRREVENLLAAHARDQGMLDGPGASNWITGGATSESEAVGEKVGPYRLIREIGRGGMGVVYLAHDTRLGRRVALKFLSAHLTADERGRERLKAEARAASRLDHPNICAVYDLGETPDGQLYLAMPYYRGRTVSDMLHDGPLAIERAVDIVRQAAMGLEQAHEAGVIHRDIKPGNLMVTHEGDVKVLDFGVAKLAGMSLSEPGMRVGTLSYMAPEQALGETVGPSADLWSLGVTLYEMIAGRRPFRGEYEPALIYEILHGEPAPLRRLRPGAPEALERAVRKLLEKAQPDRYQSAGELLADLEAWDEGGQAVLRDDVPNNLPALMTSFLGRGEEIRKVERLLESRRLLTLTGPGGVGKTRLAIETARRALGSFPDGVWFAALESVPSAEGVGAAVAAALGVEPASGGFAVIAERLGKARALLVLDNFEHLADAAPAVAELLAACENLRVLATSRAPLDVSGEQELAVAPLEAPAVAADVEDAVRNPAVALFLERARAARPDFELSAENLEAVKEICLRLEGLPLALELAAARVKLFTPQALAARLDRRLDLIAGGARDAPERRRTLRQTIQWSYDLLDPETQRVFRSLAVFSLGGSLEAAAAVAGLDEIEAADALQILASRHMIRRRESADGEPGFEMSETLRHFALEALTGRGELDEARRRHAEWHLGFAERGGRLLTGARQIDWLDRLEAERLNLSAALDWTLERKDAAAALRLTGNLWRLWLARGGSREMWGSFESALSLPRDGADPAAAARALHGFAMLAQNVGRNGAAKAALEEALAIWRRLDDPAGLAQALTSRAWVSCELSELDDAERLSREALAMHQNRGDKRGEALAWNNLGWVANYRADYEAAVAAIRKSLTLRRAAGDVRGEGFALACLAWSEQWHGEAGAAHKLLDEASRILLAVADPILLGWTLTVRALTLLDEGRLDEACEIAEKSLREWRRGANLSGEAWVLTVRGTALLFRVRLREADAELAEAERIWREVGSGWGLAMALGERARALARRGHLDKGRRALGESLALRRAIGDRRGLAHSLESAAELAGSPALAASLLGAGERLRARIGAPPAAPDRQYWRDAGLQPAGAMGEPEALETAVSLAGG